MVEDFDDRHGTETIDVLVHLDVGHHFDDVAYQNIKNLNVRQNLSVLLSLLLLLLLYSFLVTQSLGRQLRQP